MTVSLSLPWSARRERGSRMLLVVMARLTLAFGWRFGCLLLGPITLYFFLAVGDARRSSAAFLAQVLGRRASLRERFGHFHCFASTILDRPFLLTGRRRDFRVEVIGAELLAEQQATAPGLLLFGSHLGSFEILRAVADERPDMIVNPVMFDATKSGTAALFNALNPELARRIIAIGSPGSMMQVKECLDRGELVGFLADRTPPAGKSVEVEFLGRLSQFPGGPFQLAAALAVPVFLFFGIRTGPRRYEVRFEHFADRIDLPRAERELALRRWVQLYADRLAEQSRAHPMNWFNFYDFWAPRS